MTMTISGKKSTKIDALPLADSSNAPALLDPVGRLQAVSRIFLQFGPDLVGHVGRACTPSTNVRRANRDIAIVAILLRRHRIGFLVGVFDSWRICVSGHRDPPLARR